MTLTVRCVTARVVTIDDAFTYPPCDLRPLTIRGCAPSGNKQDLFKQTVNPSLLLSSLRYAYHIGPFRSACIHLSIGIESDSYGMYDA